MNVSHGHWSQAARGHAGLKKALRRTDKVPLARKTCDAGDREMTQAAREDGAVCVRMRSTAHVGTPERQRSTGWATGTWWDTHIEALTREVAGGSIPIGLQQLTRRGAEHIRPLLSHLSTITIPSSPSNSAKGCLPPNCHLTSFSRSTWDGVATAHTQSSAAMRQAPADRASLGPTRDTAPGCIYVLCIPEPIAGPAREYNHVLAPCRSGRSAAMIIACE